MGKKSRRVRDKTRVVYAEAKGRFRIRIDLNDPRDRTIYSYGNFRGGPEFIVFGVPSNKDKDVVDSIRYMSSPDIYAEKPIAHGKYMTFILKKGQRTRTLYVVTKLIEEGQQKDELLTAHGIPRNDIKNPLFELVPRFQHKDRPEDWGSVKAAPEGRSDFVNSILHIWHSEYERNEKRGFKLFLDGNKLHNTCTSTKLVDLATSLKHLDDWVVGWDDNLTPEQVSFVRTYNRYFRQVSKVLFRNVKKCGHCGLMDNDKIVRCKCKMAWYCSPECQVADWFTNHREICNEWRTLYDNQPVQRCAHCKLVDKKKLELCSRCQCTWYCCEEHQIADWPSHKLVCKQKIWVID